MTEPEPGRRAGRPQHVAELEGVEVALVERKIVDMTLARWIASAAAPTSPWPRQSSAATEKPAIEQLSDRRLEILLNEFGAAQEQRVTVRRTRRDWRPAHSAQAQTVDRRAAIWTIAPGGTGLSERDDERA